MSPHCLPFRLTHTHPHTGPDPAADAWWRTTAGRAIRRSDFSDNFHTFGVEWSENYIFTYIDSRLHTVLWVGLKEKPLWQKGEFASYVDSNSSYYVDPWSNTGRKNTPFDQPFYLILNVAVGGTNGWFPYVTHLYKSSFLSNWDMFAN